MHVYISCGRDVCIEQRRQKMQQQSSKAAKQRLAAREAKIGLTIGPPGRPKSHPAARAQLSSLRTVAGVSVARSAARLRETWAPAAVTICFAEHKCWQLSRSVQSRYHVGGGVQVKPNDKFSIVDGSLQAR